MSLSLFSGNGEIQGKNEFEKINKRISEFQRELEDIRKKGDLYREVLTLNNIGLALIETNKYKEALQYLDTALTIGKTIDAKDALAETYLNRAYVYSDWGNTEAARSNALEAKKIWDYTASSLNSARVFIVLAVLNVKESKYQDALDCYNESLKSFQQQKDARNELKALNGLGYAYFALGDYRKALDHATEVLNKANLLMDDLPKKIALTTIIDSYLNLGDQKRALIYADMALELNKKLGDSRLISYSQKQYGEIYFELGEYEKALRYYNDALILTHSLDNPLLETDLLIKIGNINNIKGNTQEALGFYSEALKLSRKLRHRTLEIRALHHISLLLRDNGAFDDARPVIEQSIKLIESSRLQIGGRKDRETYFATVRKSYELYIDILMQQHKQNSNMGYMQLALQISERARARNLREMLAESHLDWKKNVPPELLDQEQTLNKKLNAIARAVDTTTDKDKEEAEKELRSLTAQHDDVQRRIRLAAPKYASITQPQPLTVAEMQQLLDDDTAILEYSNSCPRSYVFVVTRNKVSSYEIEGRCHTDQIATKVYESLTARQLQDGKENENFEKRIERFRKADNTYWEEAKSLSKKIFTPVANDLKQSKLIIVADGSLQYIPFAALPLVKPTLTSGDITDASSNKENSNTKKMELIIDKYEISYLPSISALVELRKDSKKNQIAEKTIAVLANPVFSRNDPRFNSGSPGGGGGFRLETSASLSGDLLRAWKVVGGDKAIPSLPFSEKEGRDIFKIAPNKTGLLAIGFDARKSLVDSGELQKYRYLHFATHSLFNSEYPELSGLILSLYKLNGEREDGYLRLNDIYNMNLSADLVVLSACQTGIGKNVNGEGMIGLTRGFMYAGASRVVAGLWKVDDASTSRLMTKFYDGMFNENLPPSAALRKAQLSVMRRADGQLMPPFYWAAFIQQGEYR